MYNVPANVRCDLQIYVPVCCLLPPAGEVLPPVPSGIPISQGPTGASATDVEEDYSSWPVSELKRFLTERGEVRQVTSGSLTAMSKYWKGSCVHAFIANAQQGCG